MYHIPLYVLPTLYNKNIIKNVKTQTCYTSDRWGGWNLFVVIYKLLVSVFFVIFL